MGSQANKTFTFGGVSLLKGEWKVRYANDQMRVKVLAKTGHTEIELIQLPEPMTKAEIAKYLGSIDFANGRPEIQGAIDTADAKYNPVPKPVVVKAEAAPAVETAVEGDEGEKVAEAV